MILTDGVRKEEGTEEVEVWTDGDVEEVKEVGTQGDYPFLQRSSSRS